MALRIPLGRWLLTERSDGLKAGAIVGPGQQPGERFRASLVLESLTDRDLVKLFALLGLPPFPEWEEASGDRTRHFFGVEDDPATPTS